MNAGAIPKELAISTLFGHARGAFTGATEANPGLFIEADGGTLFIDEVAELPAEAQAALLRVLEDGIVRPVGGRPRAAPTSVLLLSATNANIPRAIECGQFREDLWHRLRGWELSVPPLPARRRDILQIAARRVSLPFEVEAAERLLLAPWPGNVRELEQVVGVAFDLAAARGATAIATADLRVDVGSSAPESPAVLIERVEVPPYGRPHADVLAAVWAEREGNLSRVARVFDRDPKQIERWLSHYGLPKPT